MSEPQQARADELPVPAVQVTVPASAANLGPGFDALGLALGLYDTVHVRQVDGRPGSAAVTVEGAGAGEVPEDERHLVVRVLHDTLAEFDVTPPALELTCRNAIPHSRGLGSSAAAITAGIAAARALTGRTGWDAGSRAEVLQLAASREGHADNVAASLHGGFVIAWSEQGRYHAVSRAPHEALSPVALVPEEESSTHRTRGLLPENIPHGDGVFTAGRAALAVHAFTAAPELLLPATQDRLHQEYRESAWPGTVALVRELRARNVPAAVSGAGPTVLALPPDGDLGMVPEGFSVLPLPVDRRGVRVRTEQ
ncbi:homoserine kinase [Salinifilum ghardaiensis]